MNTRLRHSIDELELTFLSQRVIRERMDGRSTEQLSQELKYKPFIIRQAVRRFASPNEMLIIGWSDRARHMGVRRHF